MSPLLDIPNLIAAISAFAAVVSTIVALVALFPLWRQWRVNRLLSRSFGSELFSTEVVELSTRYYVPPNCTSVDPSFESEMRNLVVTEEALFDVLDRFLDKHSSHRHLLLLADSGMGKSSCLLNYYVRNQRRFQRKRKRISIVPLGIPDADRHIQGIDAKRDTILFLDAFDEDTKAIKDHRARLRQLMELAGEFSRVLITCRTQFFLRDEEIPRETGVVRIEPRRAGEGGVYEFQKLYISPLNDRQIDDFLRKRYSVWHWSRRRRAKALVQAVPLLSVRPMLLAYIPDLLESHIQISRPFELYEAMIDAWLERERRWVDKNSLREFSEHLAVDLYCGREQRGAERIHFDEMTRLTAGWAMRLETWQLTGRSLLNRDAAGNFKFAHRSIMEYLFVSRYLAGDPLTRQVGWTDQMGFFLADIVNADKLPKSIDALDAAERADLVPGVDVFFDSSGEAGAIHVTIYNKASCRLRALNIGLFLFHHGERRSVDLTQDDAALEIMGKKQVRRSYGVSEEIATSLIHAQNTSRQPTVDVVFSYGSGDTFKVNEIFLSLRH